jgi:hypothetical protein
LLGTIFTPYFLSMPSTEAITTLAQSVSGMKPILTSSFSGLSEPCGVDEGAQRGVDASGTDGGSLQHAAAAQLRFQQIGHGANSGRKGQSKRQKQKRRPHRVEAAREASLRTRTPLSGSVGGTLRWMPPA